MTQRVKEALRSAMRYGGRVGLIADEATELNRRAAPPQASRAVAAWGVLGIALLLTQALVRLSGVALEPFLGGPGLEAHQALVCALWVGFSLYAEGYRGFQKSFVPRSVARAFYLAETPRPLHVALAPMFCMGLIHARPRRLVVSWSIVLLIVLAVILIKELPVPWRSIVDAGVVAGLAWGLVSLIASFARGLAGNVPEHELDLPRA